MILPKHDCPPCPKCGELAASPAAVSERHVSLGWNHLYCPACGHDWIEHAAAKVAQAWWSRGAYDGETLEHSWDEIESRAASRSAT